MRKRAYDVFQEAEVIPEVDFHSIEIALIITEFLPTDLSPLLGTQEPLTQ